MPEAADLQSVDLPIRRIHPLFGGAQGRDSSPCINPISTLLVPLMLPLFRCLRQPHCLVVTVGLEPNFKLRMKEPHNLSAKSL